MSASLTLTPENFLMAGYVFSSGLLNVVALFISSFYKRSLNQSAPRAGFVVAVLASLVYIFIILTGESGSKSVSIASVVSLLVYGIASSYSILMLFFTMRSVRK